MTTAALFRKEILVLTKEMTNDQLKQLFEFAQFIRERSVAPEPDNKPSGARQVRRMRTEAGQRHPSAEAFLKNLLQWQESNS